MLNYAASLILSKAWYTMDARFVAINLKKLAAGEATCAKDLTKSRCLSFYRSEETAN